MVCLDREEEDNKHFRREMVARRAAHTCSCDAEMISVIFLSTFFDCRDWRPDVDGVFYCMTHLTFNKHVSEKYFDTRRRDVGLE